jgi:hypothetical protein
MAAKEATARLEGEVAALRTHGRTTSRLGHLAATIVEADRRASK